MGAQGNKTQQFKCDHLQLLPSSGRHNTVAVFVCVLYLVPMLIDRWIFAQYIQGFTMVFQPNCHRYGVFQFKGKAKFALGNETIDELTVRRKNMSAMPYTSCKCA